MSLKQFDFFRKIQTQQELTSATGGIFTIASLIIATFLIILSFQDFTANQYRTFLAVKNDPNQYIPFKIDITFDKCPCELIELQFHDELQYLEPNLQYKLNMWKIKQGQQTKYEREEGDRQQQKKNAEKGIDQKQMCRLQGIFNVPKTPGTLTFKLTGNSNIFFQMERAKQEKVRSSYRLDKLDFGSGNNTFEFPIAHQSHMIQQYIKKLQGDVFTRTVIQDLTSEASKKNFYNHVKIIPIFVDDGTYVNEGDKQKYRFSLRSGSAAPSEIVPKVIFSTELEPINIVYKKEQMTLYNLAIDILAIVGGTVATIGVLNSISHFFFGIK